MTPPLCALSRSFGMMRQERRIGRRALKRSAISWMYVASYLSEGYGRSGPYSLGG